MTGLYDDQGVLRCAGRDAADCLAYAESRPLQWASRLAPPSGGG